MKCPACNGKSEAIDSRQLAEHRYRRYKCLVCGVRYSTGEFIVAIGNSSGGHPVKEWLTKLRTEGAAQLVQKLDALIATWRENAPPQPPRDMPPGIRKHVARGE